MTARLWLAALGARLAGTGVAVSVSQGGEGVEGEQGESGDWVELRRPDGSVAWQVSAGHVVGSLAWVPPELLLAAPGFTGDDFRPVLEVRRLRVEDGAEVAAGTLELTLPEGLPIEGGFCFWVEWTGSELLCDQTYGGPLLIDPRTGQVRSYRDLPDGVVTLRRPGI